MMENVFIHLSGNFNFTKPLMDFQKAFAIVLLGFSSTLLLVHKYFQNGKQILEQIGFYNLVVDVCKSLA